MTKQNPYDYYIDMSQRYHDAMENVLLKSEEYSATLKAGHYLVEYTPTQNSMSIVVVFLEWDPTYGKAGGWFTSKGTLIPFKNIWCIAKTEGKTPEAELLCSWRNS